MLGKTYSLPRPCLSTSHQISSCKYDRNTVFLHRSKLSITSFSNVVIQCLTEISFFKSLKIKKKSSDYILYIICRSFISIFHSSYFPSSVNSTLYTKVTLVTCLHSEVNIQSLYIIIWFDRIMKYSPQMVALKTFFLPP